ncbi:MAG: hypothetical protein ACYCXY_06315 [Acidimicrobiales bacterium]
MTTVRAVPLGASEHGIAASWLTSTVIANPISIYPRFAAERSSWLAGCSSRSRPTMG